ncbi:MAG: EamA family transporter RarD [Pseudomonadota bacterium]|nr:EamA family transporter RarD [Pseudomonadota bacterium]
MDTPVSPSSSDPQRSATIGVAYAASAYLAWGLFPLYFRAVRHVPATEILAHRVAWSVVFLACVLTFRRGWGSLHPARLRGNWGVFAATASLLSLNWLLYIWAINNGQVLQASLGYFITPLVNVVLGVLVLGESLSRAQRAAVALAALAVAYQVVGAGTVPWISLALAVTFGLYGLLRKRLLVDAVPALLLETLLMLPFAAAWMGWTAWSGGVAFAQGDPRADLFLVGTGVVTTIPLLCFAQGARRLRLTTIGLLQFIAPTCQFFLAVLVFGEAFTSTHAVMFTLIWVAVGVYVVDTVRRVMGAATSPQQRV